MPAELVSLNRHYWSIRDGFMEEYQDGQTKKYNKLSNVHLVYVDLRRVEKEGKYLGQTFRLHLIDETDYWILEMWQNGSYAMTFYKMMENLDLDKPFTILTRMYEKDGRKNHSLFIAQDGKTIKWHYTNAEPKGMPLVQSTQQPQLDGSIRTVYDSSLQLEFLLDRVKEWLLPFLRRKPNPYPFHDVWHGIRVHDNQETRPPVAREVQYTPENTTSTDEPDDLPF